MQGEYFCHKHRRTCRPVEEADKFLRRYVRDAVTRVLAFDEVRRSTQAAVLHGDARVLDPPGGVELVVTSPPYPGLIDYHEQHVYAFELLGLERRDAEEIGRGIGGYCDGVAETLGRARGALAPDGKVVVASMGTQKVTELDRAGKVVREVHDPNIRPYVAYRR